MKANLERMIQQWPIAIQREIGAFIGACVTGNGHRHPRLSMRAKRRYRHLLIQLDKLPLLALLVSACAWSQPIPPMSAATNEPAEPITYPRMVMWNAETNADSYTLTVNGTNIERTSETHSANVPLVEGTNRLSIVAHRGELTSAAATTNYVIMSAQIVEAFTVKAPSPLGPWTRAPLPGPLTNSTGTEYYKLSVNLERKTIEHHQ